VAFLVLDDKVLNIFNHDKAPFKLGTLPV